VPWVPELFSAPALERLEEKRRHELVRVPYFDGLMAGELDALVKSFAVVPELHDPVRGRVKGTRAFEAFVSVVLHVDGQNGRVDLPVAIVADLRPDGGIDELRIYFSNWPLAGRHANRPPLLQPDPELRESDVVGDYQSALAAGDVDAIVAAFEPDGYAREPAGGRHVHRGRDGLRSFYELLFSNGGGIPLEHCAVIDNERSCALEYNVVRWSKTELAPQAGVAVYVRGQSGRLAAVRIYDDADPPLGPPM
jgi:hypothetical protein